MTKGFTSQISKRLQTLQDKLAKEFTLETLSKSPARFNQKKLDWFNREYMKMMSLEEFAWRCHRLQNDEIHEGLNTRIGDYAYLVDFKNQTILVGTNENDNFPGTLDGNFILLGGKRELGEDSITGLLREIDEETPEKLDLDRNKIIYLDDFQMRFDPPITYKEITWEAKNFTVYVYPIPDSSIQTFRDPDSGFEYNWYKLVDVLAKNTYITYPIWKNFCIDHSLPYPEPNRAIITQYLAWKLDQNRITVLSEFGSESQTILRWEPPIKEDLQWKKISMGESINNLEDIRDYIAIQYESFDVPYPTHIDQIDTYLSTATAWWENSIKGWLDHNGYNTGSYLWPLRVALSGKSKSPSPFEILAIISKDEMLERIRQALL